MLTAVALFVGVVFSSEELFREDEEMSASLTSVFWFSEGSGCVLCGVSEVDLKEVVVVSSVFALSELRSVSEAAGWLCVVLGFSEVELSESPAQFAASRAVRVSRQQSRKPRGTSRAMSTARHYF